MTSNLGAHEIMEMSKNMDDSNRSTIMSNMKREVDRLLKANLRPEFLNRIDDIIVFEPLTKEYLRGIVRLRFDEVAERLADQGIDAELTDSAIEYLIGAGYDPSFGARPLKRLINSEIVQPLSKEILKGNVQNGRALQIDATGDGLVFRPKSEHKPVDA
jgi:ATP-dependent Clp protease ATP-binding subunit ClpB